MYLGEQKEKTQHTRTSKLGVDHNYYREKTVVVFRCDNCSEIFTRDRERMSPKRLNNNYFHCCSHCNPKRFAQKKVQNVAPFGIGPLVALMISVDYETSINKPTRRSYHD